MPSDESTTSSAEPSPAVRNAPPVDVFPSPGLMVRRGLMVAAAAVLAAIGGITGMHAASANVSKPVVEGPQPKPSESSPEDEDDLWRRQTVLENLRTWIEARPGLKGSGYVTNINNPEAGSTILVWHGPPDRMQRQILDEAVRRHIPISIQQRNHSMNDLEQAAQQLTAIDSGTGVFQNFRVSSVGTFDIYFDGVTVLGDFIHPPAEGVAAADTALARVLTALTGVAAKIENGQAVPA